MTLIDLPSAESNNVRAIAGPVLALLPDPLVVVRAGGGEEPTIIYGNAAAQAYFRGDLADAPLSAVLRSPAVLDAVDRAAAQGLATDVPFETIGVQPRAWRAVLRPLGEGQVMLLLRDETDARRTERMRADFLANASHELRTPLASLAGFVETLRNHAHDDEAARDRFLEIMSAQAGRMARLIDDLLSLSRIELNEHIQPTGHVDLERVASDVRDALRPFTASREVTIEVVCDTAEPYVSGDRDQLVQVVQNLVDNAMKFTPNGGTVRVALGAASRAEPENDQETGGVRLALLNPDAADPAGYVYVRIADQGPGIARQHLPRLAERFYRIEGQKADGTGLGLAIVKHIVNRHRGGLDVESEEGRGTTFTVHIPRSS